MEKISVLKWKLEFSFMGNTVYRERKFSIQMWENACGELLAPMENQPSGSGGVEPVNTNTKEGVKNNRRTQCANQELMETISPSSTANGIPYSFTGHYKHRRRWFADATQSYQLRYKSLTFKFSQLWKFKLPPENIGHYSAISKWDELCTVVLQIYKMAYF